MQVGHVEQFNPAWQAAQDYIVAPQWVEATRESSYTGRSTDIGVVLDLMIHDLDLIVKSSRSSVARVEATGWSILGQHEDVAHARLWFQSGCIANLRASRVSRNLTRKMHVTTAAGFAEIDFGAGTADVVQISPEVASKQRQADVLPTSERLQVKEELFTEWMPHQRLSVTPTNAIADELSDFGIAIRTGVNRKLPASMPREFFTSPSKFCLKFGVPIGSASTGQQKRSEERPKSFFQEGHRTVSWDASSKAERFPWPRSSHGKVPDGPYLTSAREKLPS